MHRPYGWIFGEDGYLWPHDGEHVVVERVRHLRRQGHTLREIADALNAAGYTNRAGGAFLPTQVHRILKRVAQFAREC